MALSTVAYVAEGTVYDLGIEPSQYATGGTALGDDGSIRALTIDHTIDLLTKQTSNSYYGMRVLETGGVFECTILNPSQALWDVVFHARAGTLGYTGISTGYPLGNMMRPGDNGLRTIMCRASVNTKASMLLPAAGCVELGPLIWSRDGQHLEQATLTLVAFDDSRVGGPVFYGDYADWPTYNPSAPTIAAINPNTGAAAGGTVVVISGTNLRGASVTFGGSAALVLYSQATAVVVRTPAHAAGAVDVVVTTQGGTATSAGGFTYA